MKKRVLITGASGFIGRYVVKKFLEKKYNVIALVHAKHSDFDADVQVIEADISEESIIASAAEKIKQCDVLVHLAANLDMKGSDETISVNCMGTYHLIRLAALLSVQKFIYISSIPVIGNPKFLPVTEEHPIAPATLYHISKYMGEQMLNSLCPPDMETVILRIPSPIGVGMSEHNYLSFLLNKFKKNEPVELFGQGLRRQNYIDVRDIASAILCATEAPATGLFLIAGKQEISNRDFAFLCKEITNSQSEITWGKRDDPEEENQWVIAATKAEEQLGFSPEYDLKDTLCWIYDTAGKSR